MPSAPLPLDSSAEAITIRGARQHNLQGIDVSFPKGALTVVSGLSGSGKSSLAFDTLYAEGQRAYVESLSTYSRQFLEQLEAPDVDEVLGIQPAIAIRQRNSVKSSRSTVGTATEVYDYLRVLFARAGRIRCHRCGREVSPDRPDRAAEATLDRFETGEPLLVLFPVECTETLSFQELRERLVAQGYLRIWLDDEVLHLEELPADLSEPDSVEVIADRIRADASTRARLTEAIELALHAGEGDAAVVDPESGDRLDFSDRWQCPVDGERYEQPTPQLFSFNSPQGACPGCNGFGERLEIDERKVVPDLDKSIAAGAIRPWASDSWREEFELLLRFCEERGIPTQKPFRKLGSRQKRWILEHEGQGYVGVLPWLRDMREHPHSEGQRFFTRRYLGRARCRDCGGGRLRNVALAVRLPSGEQEKSIGDLSHLDLPQLLTYLEGVDAEWLRANGAYDVWQEAVERVRFLLDIGLAYLQLDRASRSLSGGEMQRIHLSNALGSRLVETLYVLDEPSIGLHPRDTALLLESLRALARAGNTVVVVEHDPMLVAAAEHLIDLGPGAGSHGGQLLYAGPPPRPGQPYPQSSKTCAHLAGDLKIPCKAERRTPGRRRLHLQRVRRHNLKEFDLRLPLGLLVCVSGVSGSGKSTLINEILFPALDGNLSGGRGRQFDFDDLHGADNLSDALLVDQSPIGRSSRSNPATYLQVMGDIRELLAQTKDAKARGWTAGRFSFNTAGGRCAECQGMGEVTVEMQFMADLTVPCEVCHGLRFDAETLEVRYRGRNVAEILDLTVDEAIGFFSDRPQIGSKLWLLQKVGLGYLRLGQSASTLSGGESQRIKIARELLGGKHGHRLYLLDEPTTGLHAEDIRRLLKVLEELVEAGNSVLLIEHNLDVLKNADWIIDLGPGGGPDGGRIVAEGPPEEIVACGESATGRALAAVLDPNESRRERQP
jgi:excinuclease ABC subunit A